MSRLLKQIKPSESDVGLQKILKDVECSGGKRKKNRTSTAGDPAVTQQSVQNTATTSSNAPGVETPDLTDQQNTSPESEAPVTPADIPQIQVTSPADSMSLNRIRAGRSNARGGSQDISAQTIWNDFNRDHLSAIKESEAKSKVLKDKIIELEMKMNSDKESAAGVSLADMKTLDDHYRELTRVTDDTAAKIRNEGIATTLTMLIEMKRQEEQAALEKARASSSRPGLEVDGASDSPIPSPADSRHIKKLGTSRTGSQPPNRSEGTPSEASERNSKPKIVYAKNEQVAFKRKTAAKPEEQDWILGKVCRVIGEGKSRRYEIEDPYPDTDVVEKYKSSASQMVPIPPEGTPLEDYEIGRRVLAQYPDTTTFYRAEVKAMLDGGANVQLLFEDEAAGELKIVTRRLVLDHKG